MENSLYKVNEIMNPFFEEQEKIEVLKMQINTVKLKLASLDTKEEEEIENYKKSNPYFYSNIRKDLQVSYKEDKEKLNKNLNDLYLSYNNEVLKLTNIGKEITKKLILEQETIEAKYEIDKKEFDNIQQELSDFKYEYNEQNQVINGNAWRDLYERSVENSKKIENLNIMLEKIKHNLNLIEFIEINYPKISEEVKEEKDTKKEETNNFLNSLYEEIMEKIAKLSCVKIETIDDESLENLDDSKSITEAIKNLYGKPKGNVYVVDQIDPNQNLTQEEIIEINKQFKKNGMLMLINEGKIAKIDLLRAFGKSNSEQILFDLYLDSPKKSKPVAVDYISKEDVIKILKKILVTQKENEVSLEEKKANLLNISANLFKEDEEKNNIYRIK